MLKMTKADICGWAGMILIQSATVPITVANIAGWSKALPPLSMVLLVWSGLALYLVRGIYHKDMVAIVGNALGFFLNSMLLALIVFPFN